MKKIPFPLLKLLNICIVLLPFLGCWYGYYEPRTLTAGAAQVSILMSAIFSCVFYGLSHRLDGFRTSILRIDEIIISQILSVMATDLLCFVIIWMLSGSFPNLLPGLCAFGAQCVLIAAWAVVSHKLYFATHKPLRTAVVYDCRQGMEKLIKTYGMESRFCVERTFSVEQAMENLSQLDDMQAVFLSGVHSADRNVILKYCTYRDISLYVIPRVGDVMMSGAEQMHLFHLPILRSQRTKTPVEFRMLKRLVDVVCSGLALVVFSPVMLATALAIRSDGGPALYRQVRLTKDGKEFEILKFRSMCVDAEKTSGAVLSAGEHDPRITKVGRFIRACRLDELPQLINILKGDMSIVGPRPERPEIAAQYEKELPEFKLRLQVKAGLTGYAQVYGKYNTTPYDKLLMDLMYISKPSLLEDLSIILATVKILFSKESTEGVQQGQSTAMGETSYRKGERIA